ncbi:hypothetical protein J6590_101795 [Homalodisca vitripennis]|nr:hypothetical protein J6590_101795 [Homalodisca vitripennis]
MTPCNSDRTNKGVRQDKSRSQGGVDGDVYMPLPVGRMVSGRRRGWTTRSRSARISAPSKCCVKTRRAERLREAQGPSPGESSRSHQELVLLDPVLVVILATLVWGIPKAFQQQHCFVSSMFHPSFETATCKSYSKVKLEIGI